MSGPHLVDVIHALLTGAARPVRAPTGGVAAGLRLARADGEVLRHALVELVTNVIEHAFIDSPNVHTCEITVTLTGHGELRARVADRGRWRTPIPTPDRGLGLNLTESLVDRLRIEHDEHGTTVLCARAAGPPAHPHRPHLAPDPKPAGQSMPLLLDQP